MFYTDLQSNDTLWNYYIRLFKLIIVENQILRKSTMLQTSNAYNFLICGPILKIQSLPESLE